MHTLLKELLIPQPTEEKPVEVKDYPYGFRQRTVKQYWVETTKHGQRVVTRTLNPKTSLWNKPKKSTYSDIRVLYRNRDNGHIENDGLSFTYAGQQELDNFLKDYPEDALSDYQQSQLKLLRAIIKTRKHVKVSLVTNPNKEEQERIETNNEKTNKQLRLIFEHYIREEKDK